MKLKMTEGEVSKTYQGVAMPPKPEGSNTTRRLNRVPKRASARFCHPANLHKIGLKPSAPPEQQPQYLRKKVRNTTADWGKTKTTEPGCELGLDADSETTNDSREPSPHPQSLKTKEQFLDHETNNPQSQRRMIPQRRARLNPESRPSPTHGVN